jgi:hypothetical protein
MTVTADYLEQLNPSQRLAVEHFCGPCWWLLEQDREKPAL